MLLRNLTLLSLIVFWAVASEAHHPERECQEVRQRVDVIGPLGTHLPSSHRRQFNRPRKVGGRIAYYVAPSSQEAMAWHKSKHRGHYKHHGSRVTMHYFAPKPWEALPIGARPPQTQSIEVAPEDPMALPPDYSMDAGLSYNEFDPQLPITE